MAMLKAKIQAKLHQSEAGREVNKDAKFDEVQMAARCTSF